MNVLTFLAKNWDSVLVVVAFLALVVVLIKRGETKILKQILFNLCNAGRKAVRKRYGFPEICRRRGLDLSANPGGAETTFHVQRY